jgi:arabinofuranosyltransferase
MSADRNAHARSVAVEPSRTRLDTLLLLALVGGLVLLALRCAWVCDDAYITFRVVDNFVEGYGLRWNTVERVQAYTNPLWMGLVTLPYALTREPYYTSLALSLACTALVGLGFALKVTRDIAGAALALTVLCGSKAFVDFSTSGLENPLLHVALLGALATWTSPEPDRNRSLKLGLWGSAVALTRLDALALLAPVLAAHLWHERSMRAGRQLALGFAPLVAWELFSLAYYGAWIPNSAISKLSSGLPQSELSAQGVSYLANSLALDPLTLLAIAAATPPEVAP